MKIEVILMVVFTTSVSMAFQSGINWFVIDSNQTKAFWTNSTSQQIKDLNSGQSHIFEWNITASGAASKYNLSVMLDSNAPNVTDMEVFFNGTIFDKGFNGSNVIPNYTCTGCAFNTSGANPKVLGELNNNSTITEWNITAGGLQNSTWDLFVHFDYPSSTEREKDTKTVKARIVDYPWWNTSFNCRRLVNVTQNTGSSGNGIVQISGYSPDNACDIINCTKEVRITEILTNKSQEYKTNLSIDNETYVNEANSYTHCTSTNIKYNANLNANQTKQFFIYYNNPIVEADYSPLNSTQNTIANQSFSNVYTTEKVWDLFFDSHLDTSWNSTADLVSTNSRNQSNFTKSKLLELNYTPAVTANRLTSEFNSTIKNDKIYWFMSHGGIDGPGSYNQTFFEIKRRPQEVVLASDVTNISGTLQAKFVMVISSFGGDNGTSLIGCPLNNWLSKAFTDKGADCFLAFRGTNENTTCNACNCESDVKTPSVDRFNECFWRNITTGKTIRQARDSADVCDSPSEMNPILVERYAGACDQTLIK